MSDYITNKIVKTYFDAIVHFNLLEKEVTSVKRKGSVVIINTEKKSFFKTLI
jgi:hypothetical protein